MSRSKTSAQLSTLDLPKASGVYAIRCLVSFKVYVGSSVNVAQRCRKHKRLLRDRRHTSIRLQSAWNKYGSEFFLFELLELVPDANQLLVREQFWIDELNAFSEGYNCNPIAGNLLGFRFGPMSEEAKRKISLAKKGMPGHPHSEAAKAKISAARKGKPLSTEHKMLLSRLKKGVSRKPHSEITKTKIGLAFKGKVHCEAARTKMSRSHTGQKRSVAHRRAISEGLRRNPVSEDGLRRIAAATISFHTGRKRSQETCDAIKAGLARRKLELASV